MNRIYPFTAVFAAAVALGCAKSEDDEYAPAILPKSYAFEGKIDPNFVGDWKTADGTSALAIGEDGTVKIQTVTRSRSGKNTANVDGKWLSSDGSLMFEYGDSTKGMTVLKYDAKLAKDSLVLQQSGGRIKTTYLKK